jgi:hypothetical protein
MTLNEIFPDGGEFMDWLANNCYSCGKLGDDDVQHNPDCELEPIISYSDPDKEIDDKLVKQITENGKVCKCKNFVRTASRLLGIFMLLFIFTGCGTNGPKTYTNKINFYESKAQKILYAQTEEENIPYEYRKLNFPEPLIAENKLKIQMLYRLNQYNKSFMPVARQEIREVRKFTAGLKAEISEKDNQYKQIEELKKEIKKSNQKIRTIKSGAKK